MSPKPVAQHPETPTPRSVPPMPSKDLDEVCRASESSADRLIQQLRETQRKITPPNGMPAARISLVSIDEESDS